MNKVLNKVAHLAVLAVSFLVAAVAAAADNGLPESIRQAGVLKFGGDPSYPPFVSVNDKNELQGFDVDIANEIAKRLGVRAEFINVKTDGIVPGLQSGKFEIGISGVIDSEARQRYVDFVDYYRGLASLIVKSGNPFNISPSTICGKQIAVGKGSFSQVVGLEMISKNCAAQGKPGVEGMQFPDGSAAILAVESGRAPTHLSFSVIHQDIVAKSNGKLEFAGILPQTGAHFGLPMLKGNDALVQAVSGALTQMMADGTYKKLLAKNNMPLTDVLERPTINQLNAYP